MNYVTEQLEQVLRRVEKHLRFWTIKKDEYMISTLSKRVEELKTAIDVLKGVEA